MPFTHTRCVRTQIRDLDALYRTLAGAARESDHARSETLLRRAIDRHFTGAAAGAAVQQAAEASHTASSGPRCRDPEDSNAAPDDPEAAVAASTAEQHGSTAAAARSGGGIAGSPRGAGHVALGQGDDEERLELPIQTHDRFLVADIKALMVQNRLAKVGCHSAHCVQCIMYCTLLAKWAARMIESCLVAIQGELCCRGRCSAHLADAHTFGTHSSIYPAAQNACVDVPLLGSNPTLL